MIPLTVRLANANADRHITQQLAEAPSFRTVIPGGFASAQFTLQNPITVNDPLLAPFTRVYIYDGRNGDLVWEGRLQQPARSAGTQGQVWALTAVGPSAHTLDQTAPLIYIDGTLENWVRDILEGQYIAPSAQAGASTHPRTDELDALCCTWPQGLSINSSPSSRVSVGYYGFIGSGMTVGALHWSYSTTGTNANLSTEVTTGVSPTYLSTIYASVFDGVGATVNRWVIDDFIAGRDIAGLRCRRTAGGLTTLASDTWTVFYGVRILGRRMTKTGTLVSGSAGMVTTDYVRASWIVADLLGRMLPQYDGANAVIDATDLTDIDQLAYLDPVTPNQVLEDLMRLEPSKFWAAWESNSAGEYRFEWSTWNGIQYEATVADGFESPAPSTDLYNKVRVRYRDVRGRIRTVSLTQSIPELDDNGIVREFYIDISDEAGSVGNATTVGTNWLGEHNQRTSVGTLTVARDILDVQNNRAVAPWQIRPGRLIRIRGIEASAATNIAEGTRDGVTVFRVVSVEVNSDGVATLELDQFTRSEARALATLWNRRNRKR